MPRQTTLQPGALIAPRPPLMAYREDLARRGDRGAFGPSVSTCLRLATVLGHLVGVPPESRAPLGVSLRELVADDPSLSGTLAAAEGDQPPEHELDGVSPMVRAVVDRIEDEGALNLAYSTLWLLADADLRLSVLERGRVIAQLGRVAWKAGALETSRDQYRRVEVLGRAAQNAELRVRAWVGYSILARLRGNYPEVRKWAARAAHEADRAGLKTLGSLAYHSLMVSASTAGDISAALVYGWRAFETALGEPAREADMLLNVAQLLLRAGHSDAALHGFDAALGRNPTARIALPALGGVAVAAAALADSARVHEARRRADRLIAAGGLPYESAAALLELSQALAEVGDTRAARECHARAMDAATRHGYHELSHRLESLQFDSAPVRAGAARALDASAIAVARAVASLGLVGSGADAG